MPLARYDGHYPVTYPAHRNAETGTALEAVPGRVYDVLPAVPADGRWTAPPPKTRKRAAKAAPSPESEG